MMYFLIFDGIFKAPINTKGIWSVNDIVNEELPESPPTLDINTDTPPEYVQPPNPSHPELSVEEKEKLKVLVDRINELQKQLNEQKEYEKYLTEFEKKITTQTNYRTQHPEAIKIYLLSKGELITKYLNDQQKLPEYFIGKIPKLFFHEHGSEYIADLTGIQTHHHEFELMLQRISHLSYETQHAKYEYKRQISQITESVMIVMTKRIKLSHTWKHYTNYFLQILKEKKEQYIEYFDEYITFKSKLLTDEVINNTNSDLRKKLEVNMAHYKDSKSFTYELEKIKDEALNEFIKQHIFLPQQQFDRKPSKESIKTLNTFIDKKKEEMKTDQAYKGLDVKHFKLISKILQTLTLYYHCFELQLPLFESAPELLEKIHHNTVVTISTSTGSGKENKYFYFESLILHNGSFCNSSLI